MNETFKKITKKFGIKELILCLVLAAVVTIFIVVFTGNVTNVNFNAYGGEFDEGDGATMAEFVCNKEIAVEESEGGGFVNYGFSQYYEVLEKSFRISSVATLPEPTREGYNFEGWYYGTMLADGTVSYVYTAPDGTVAYDKEFTEDMVKNLGKDSTTDVYAKWTPIVEGETAEKTMGENVVAALNITWKGMLGIFLVIGIIFLVIVGLNLATKKVSELKAKKENK